MAGIKQTMDVVSYLKAILEELKKHKADDGKIDMSEIVTTVASTVPSAISALLGVKKIEEELADLDDTEKRVLMEQGSDLIILLAEIFLPEDDGE